MQRIESSNITTDSDGNWIFTDGPPGTTVTADWLNSVQEEIANVIESAGLNLKRRTTDTHDQLETAVRRIATEYDYIVTSQTTFNDLFERTAANEYKIKDNYKSVFIKDLSSGYQVSGILGGADTYANISTNFCELIFCMPGAFFDFENTQGYINVNTANCSLFNMDVQGTKTVASPIPQSYLLAASYVSFYNCRSSLRLSNAGAANYFAVFRGGTAAQNRTSKYIGCTVENCQSEVGTNQIYGFKNCQNMMGCRVENLDATGAAYGFIDCSRVNNFVILDVVSSNGASYGIGSTTGNGCYNISNGLIQTITSSGGSAYGISGFDATDICRAISNIYIEDIASSKTGSSVYGIIWADNISSCYLTDLDKTHASAGAVYGFTSCHQITGCEVKTLDSAGSGNVAGMFLCTQISGCKIFDLDSNGTAVLYGMNNCENIGSCEIHQLTGINVVCGINASYQISNVKIHDLDSTGSTIYGMLSSNSISACQIYDLETSFATGDIHGMNTCLNISGCLIKQLDIDINDAASANDIKGMVDCENISSCRIEDIDLLGGIGDLYGMDGCNNISACTIFDLQMDDSSVGALGGTGDLWGMNNCDRIGNIIIQQLDKTETGTLGGIQGSGGVSNCCIDDLDNLSAGAVYGIWVGSQITGCQVKDINQDVAGTGPVYGFRACSRVSACYALQIKTTGNNPCMAFENCNNISSCQAASVDATHGAGGSAYGFANCDSVSACSVNLIIAVGGNGYGFMNCDYIAGCYANGIGGAANEGFTNCSYVGACHTTEGVNTGLAFMNSEDLGGDVIKDYSCSDFST